MKWRGLVFHPYTCNGVLIVIMVEETMEELSSFDIMFYDFIYILHMIHRTKMEFVFIP